VTVIVKDWPDLVPWKKSWAPADQSVPQQLSCVPSGTFWPDAWAVVTSFGFSASTDVLGARFR
jgi:hypothetical protein